jgi:hypothetical protein
MTLQLMNPPWSIICRCLAEYLPALEDSLNGLVSCVVVLQFSCQCHVCKIYRGSGGFLNVNWLLWFSCIEFVSLL